jgi:hypothetical protein
VDLADSVPAKFLIGMMLLKVLISAGGHGVLERRNDSVWVREMYHFGGGNPSFDRGAWCTWAEEIVDLRKKTRLKTEMCCHLMP